MNNIKFFSAIICLFCFNILSENEALAIKAPSGNEVANNIIIIKGNERLTNEDIESYLDVAGIKRNNSKAISNSLKKIYASDLFSDVKIYRQDSKMIVEVKENPMISEIKFVGNKKIDDDILQNEISLKKRAIFSKTKLQNDVKRIGDIYLKTGRFLTKIEPKIITNEQNRIELIFDIYEGQKAKIGSLNFIGNNVFSDQDLLDEITTKQSHWYRFFSSSDVYDSDRIDFDKEKLRRFYASQGYADFNVVSSIAQITPNKDNFFVTFLLEEGIEYRVGDVEISNNIPKLDSKLLQGAILIKKGKIYDESLIEKTLDQMTEVMSDQGYAFANVEPVLKRNKDKKIIDINFVIEETPRVYINEIRIIGNVRTYNDVILRELRFRQGDAYNITKINRSRQRLINLDFFDKVEFQTKRIGNSDKVDIEIEVKEKKTGEVNFGIGYSTVDQAIGSVGFKEINLFGTGQEIGASLQKSATVSSAQINYLKPHFMDYPVDAGIDIFKTKQTKHDTLVYDEDSLGFGVSAGYSITEFLYHKVRYSYRDGKINNVDANASINIKSLAGNSKTSTIEQDFTYDKTDNSKDPKDGYIISLNQAYSGLGGDVKNIKHEGMAAYYLPTISKEYILKFLARGGVIRGIGQGIKSNDGFFLGGNNFRGFEFAGIGPRVISRGSAVDGDIVGGKIYYMGSVEFRFPLGLPKELGLNGALFTDFGTVRGVDPVSKKGVEIADTGSIRASYGASVVWSSPLGLIRLDFSQIAKKEKFDRTENFRFSIGTTF